MRFHLPCGVLALVIGASAAQAQTVITGPVVGQPVGPVVAAPAATVVQPAETIQTIQTVRTVRAAPLPPVRRQVVTTRTITRRVIPAAPAVVAGTVAPAPLYDAAVPAAVPAPAGIYGAPAYDYADYPDYGAPLYDVAPAATVAPAPVVAAPVVAAPVATAPMIYRYVYEPDRILVIDPTTNIAVQAIPR
jgi:ribonuclease E